MGSLISDYNSNIEYYNTSMPAGRGMTTSPVLGRPGVRLHEGKASGLVVKVWDAHARSLLSFSLNERIPSGTTVKVRSAFIFSRDLSLVSDMPVAMVWPI